MNEDQMTKFEDLQEKIASTLEKNEEQYEKFQDLIKQFENQKQEISILKILLEQQQQQITKQNEIIESLQQYTQKLEQSQQNYVPPQPQNSPTIKINEKLNLSTEIIKEEDENELKILQPSKQLKAKTKSCTFNLEKNSEFAIPIEKKTLVQCPTCKGKGKIGFGKQCCKCCGAGEILQL